MGVGNDSLFILTLGRFCGLGRGLFIRGCSCLLPTGKGTETGMMLTSAETTYVWSGAVCFTADATPVVCPTGVVKKLGVTF